MEYDILIALYILIASFVIFRMIAGLLKSKVLLMRYATYFSLFVFISYLSWGLFSFFKNEHGKSSTVGLFALEFFLITSFTIFALLCLLLRLIERKFK